MDFNKVTISFFLDTRRVKESGLYPLKIRVYRNQPRTQKLYPLPTHYDVPNEYTKDEFASIWETTKPRRKYEVTRNALSKALNDANEVARQMHVFDFDEFELKYFKTTSTKRNVNHFYDKAIEAYKANGQVSTASNYELSLKSLLAYHGKKQLDFATINKKWLQGYESHMMHVKEASLTTVGIYLRPLRAIFNTAISEKALLPELYPFGVKKYTIPAPKSIKKALNKDELSILFNAKPKTIEQEQARDFWFFSYACNGMNFKDIALLRYKNIQGELMIFNRAKTSKTNKSQVPVRVYLSGHALEVIEKYGNPSKLKDSLIFSIIDETSTSIENHTRLKNFIRKVNQHIKLLALENGITGDISTYWARHSFATVAIRQGASMEYVSEALSHSNLNTTKSYFAGFADDEKKKVAASLMDF